MMSFVRQAMRLRAWQGACVALLGGCLTPPGAKVTTLNAPIPAHPSANDPARPTLEPSNGAGGRPPSPPGADVPRPSAHVVAPNLRVLPWAGFRAAVTFTFDDSQPSHIEHWPELRAAGVPMTFFVNPSDRWGDEDAATWRAVPAAGNEIGNHTRSHCRVDSTGCLPNENAAEDIDRATADITSRLGANAVYSFAAPFGDTSWNRYAPSRFLVGRGISSGIVPPTGASDWYDLPCFPVEAGQGAAAFDAGIDRARSQHGWIIFMFHSLLPTAANWYAGVETAGVTASFAYGKSRSDVWMDTMAAIGAYARGQQLLERATPTDNHWTWTLPAHFPPGRIVRVTIDGGALSQETRPLAWDAHGYYEVALDAGTLAWKP